MSGCRRIRRGVQDRQPPTEKVLSYVAAGDHADVDAAVHAARQAFDGGLGPGCAQQHGGQLLRRLADLMDEHREEPGELESPTPTRSVLEPPDSDFLWKEVR
jgi:acyl-CoA reductase-like NAD-dependent aldehyde dehydrogenase